MYMNERYQAMKAAQEYILELEGIIRGLQDSMDDYIGLANTVNCLVSISPDHMLYDSIRGDVMTYLERIQGEDTDTE